MKILKTFCLIIFLSLVLVGCENADVTLDGTLHGTIDSYSSTSFNVVKFIDLQSSSETVLGSCTPESSGKFSMTLSVPSLSTLANAQSGISVSDKSAQIGMGGVLGAYKNANLAGYLIKTNLTSFSGSITEINGSLALFMYSDRNVTLKGSFSSGTTTESYDLNLKKGWNEVNFKMNMSSTTSTVSITGTVPSDLKWKFFSASSSQTIIKKLNVRGMKL
ncbi:MAG: hypothetical protein WCL70_11200 [Paludibacter sp.]